ncbi:YuiA family protein [Microaerobacter geothermalis]|uniref:YuiA family protein n=1 Tax=Microaerobacter geothermalis TaxID=674972 RepID=UPI001F269C2B|nr:YuiA family protein [Microaerobacter geothermalis]MCF6092462.1 YuiA family protein [Microaerobacter geothermalis]
MKNQGLAEEFCEYCNGNGYYQLLLGGSETCASCQGTGKKTNYSPCENNIKK